MTTNQHLTSPTQQERRWTPDQVYHAAVVFGFNPRDKDASTLYIKCPECGTPSKSKKCYLNLKGRVDSGPGVIFCNKCDYKAHISTCTQAEPDENTTHTYRPKRKRSSQATLDVKAALLALIMARGNFIQELEAWAIDRGWSPPQARRASQLVTQDMLWCPKASLFMPSDKAARRLAKLSKTHKLIIPVRDEHGQAWTAMRRLHRAKDKQAKVKALPASCIANPKECRALGSIPLAVQALLDGGKVWFVEGEPDFLAAQSMLLEQGQGVALGAPSAQSMPKVAQELAKALGDDLPYVADRIVLFAHMYDKKRRGKTIGAGEEAGAKVAASLPGLCWARHPQSQGDLEDIFKTYGDDEVWQMMDNAPVYHVLHHAKHLSAPLMDIEPARTKLKDLVYQALATPGTHAIGADTSTGKSFVVEQWVKQWASKAHQTALEEGSKLGCAKGRAVVIAVHSRLAAFDLQRKLRTDMKRELTSQQLDPQGVDVALIVGRAGEQGGTFGLGHSLKGERSYTNCTNGDVLDATAQGLRSQGCGNQCPFFMGCMMSGYTAQRAKLREVTQGKTAIIIATHDMIPALFDQSRDLAPHIEALIVDEQPRIRVTNITASTMTHFTGNLASESIPQARHVARAMQWLQTQLQNWHQAQPQVEYGHQADGHLILSNLADLDEDLASMHARCQELADLGLLPMVLSEVFATLQEASTHQDKPSRLTLHSPGFREEGEPSLSVMSPSWSIPARVPVLVTSATLDVFEASAQLGRKIEVMDTWRLKAKGAAHVIDGHGCSATAARKTPSSRASHLRSIIHLWEADLRRCVMQRGQQGKDSRALIIAPMALLGLENVKETLLKLLTDCGCSNIDFTHWRSASQVGSNAWKGVGVVLALGTPGINLGAWKARRRQVAALSFHAGLDVPEDTLTPKGLRQNWLEDAARIKHQAFGRARAPLDDAPVFFGSVGMTGSHGDAVHTLDTMQSYPMPKGRLSRTLEGRVLQMRQRGQGMFTCQSLLDDTASVFSKLSSKRLATHLNLYAKEHNWERIKQNIPGAPTAAWILPHKGLLKPSISDIKAASTRPLKSPEKLSAVIGQHPLSRDPDPCNSICISADNFRKPSKDVTAGLEPEKPSKGLFAPKNKPQEAIEIRPPTPSVQVNHVDPKSESQTLGQICPGVEPKIIEALGSSHRHWPCPASGLSWDEVEARSKRCPSQAIYCAALVPEEVRLLCLEQDPDADLNQPSTVATALKVPTLEVMARYGMRPLEIMKRCTIVPRSTGIHPPCEPPAKPRRTTPEDPGKGSQRSSTSYQPV